MSIDLLQTIDIIEIMENNLEAKRPPMAMRNKLDISYKIEDQGIVVFEIRPIFRRPNEWQECDVAKTTYVKSQNIWKLFWKRADLKWHSYTPQPKINTLHEFLEILEEDKMSCFWG